MASPHVITIAPVSKSQRTDYDSRKIIALVGSTGRETGPRSTLTVEERRAISRMFRDSRICN